eukprot:11858275-Prorocentrum_lima.AAC.1
MLREASSNHKLLSALRRRESSAERREGGKGESKVAVQCHVLGEWGRPRSKPPGWGGRPTAA